MDSELLSAVGVANLIMNDCNFRILRWPFSRHWRRASLECGKRVEARLLFRRNNLCRLVVLLSEHRA